MMMTAVDWWETLCCAAPPVIYSGSVKCNSLRIVGKLHRAGE